MCSVGVKVDGGVVWFVGFGLLRARFGFALLVALLICLWGGVFLGWGDCRLLLWGALGFGCFEVFGRVDSFGVDAFMFAGAWRVDIIYALGSCFGVGVGLGVPSGLCLLAGFLGFVSFGLMVGV